jgi:Protein of unknown function (DUF2865)
MEGAGLSVRERTVSENRENTVVVKRSLIAFGMAAFSLALPLSSASAAGIFEFLFGGLTRALPSARPSHPQVRAYTDPSGGIIEGERRSGGPSVTYCVRLCDGHPFPVQSSNSSPAQACASMCPAAATKVFAGGNIDYAVAFDGKRYAELPNAFVYRKQLVAGCTCNGKTAGGLVSADVKSDPTLRPGDIVATNDGLVSYRGSNGKGAEFTPVQDRKLAKIEIRPAPPSAAALAANASAELPLPSIQEPAPKGRRAQR